MFSNFLILTVKGLKTRGTEIRLEDLSTAVYREGKLGFR